MVPVSGDPAQGTVRVTQRIYFAHAAVMNRRRALQIDSPCLAYECLSHPQKMSATNPPARTAIAKAIVIFMASPYWGWYCASHSSTLKAKQHTTPSLGNHRQIMRFPYNKRFMPRYSIVVPLHNEQENVTDLYDRLKAVMEINGESFEIVLVDDGSTDRSFHLLREIAAVDSRVTVVRLRRNFGQTSALAAGFDHARGEYIIAMDGDLQHDPADIPRIFRPDYDSFLAAVSFASASFLRYGWDAEHSLRFWSRGLAAGAEISEALRSDGAARAADAVRIRAAAGWLQYAGDWSAGRNAGAALS